MSYLPLARKYRPMKFSDLVGQESVTKALANAMKLGRQPHAVIFSGVRGIGKTTTARLYAKALNCMDVSSVEPCGKCSSCEAITKSKHEDVIEIDGASNNGIDEIRSIRDSVSYVPQRSKYKIYIIDEVHMLSTNAFNALLKTLEEPPSHVVFIFATTELQKVPQTVIGRCQTFYLQKIKFQTMMDRIAEILNHEDIEYEEKALSLVAREGRGSMRDALSFLDQSIALGDGGVTVDGVSQLTSNLSAAPYIELLASMVGKQGEKLLDTVEKLDQEGQNFRDVCEETAKVARHCFILRDLGKSHLDIALLGLEDQDLTRLDEIAKIVQPMDLNRIFRTLVKCVSDMDDSSLDRYIFENYLLEWCFDPGFPSVEQLLNSGEANIQNNVAATNDRPIKQTSVKKSLMTSYAQVKSEFEKKSPKTFVDKNSNIEDSPKTDSFSGAYVRPALQSKDVSSIETSGPEKANPGELKSSPSNPEKSRFPTTWRDLVDAWKKQKPLQARKLEEVHPIEFGPEKIVVAVDPAGIVGPTLLKKETQLKISAAFKTLFDFSGSFTAVPRSGATKEEVMGDYNALGSSQHCSDFSLDKSEKKEESQNHKLPEDVDYYEKRIETVNERLPASILEQKQDELKERVSFVTKEAQEAPLTNLIQKTMGLRSGRVEITSQELL